MTCLAFHYTHNSKTNLDMGNNGCKAKLKHNQVTVSGAKN